MKCGDRMIQKGYNSSIKLDFIVSKHHGVKI